MAAYRRMDDLKSPAGWLPVHRDHLRAQLSVTIMGTLYRLADALIDDCGQNFTESGHLRRTMTATWRHHLASFGRA